MDNDPADRTAAAKPIILSAERHTFMKSGIYRTLQISVASLFTICLAFLCACHTGPNITKGTYVSDKYDLKIVSKKWDKVYLFLHKEFKTDVPYTTPASATYRHLSARNNADSVNTYGREIYFIMADTRWSSYEIWESKWFYDGTHITVITPENEAITFKKDDTIDDDL